MSRKFYVYLHLRKTDGKVFYVGKGSGNRAWSKWDRHRNPWWHRVVLKHGYYVEIAHDEMNEDDAFLLEMWLIAKFRHEGFPLVNLTDGGEGCSGMAHSEESRERIRRKKIGIKLTEEHKRKVSESLTGCKRSEETRAKLRENRLRNPTNNLKHDGRVVCRSDGKCYESIADASRSVSEEQGISATHGNIWLCASGKRNSAYGYTWAFDGVIPEKRKDIKGRRIVRMDTMQVYRSASEASREFIKPNGKQANKKTIQNAAKKSPHLAYGIEWRYEDEIS